MNLGGGVHLVHTKVGQALIVAGPPLTIIDTGRPGSIPRIARALRRLGKRVEDIEQIVITHAHHDHIGSAAALRERSGARVMIHHGDAAVARGDRDFYALGKSGAAAAITSPWRERLQAWARFPHVQIDAILDDASVVEPGLEVVATPGHSPGHISVLLPEIELLHVGDALWNVIRTGVAPQMFNLDTAAAMRSVQRLATLDGYRRATFGHGPPIWRGARRRIARIARRYKT